MHRIVLAFFIAAILTASSAHAQWIPLYEADYKGCVAGDGDACFRVGNAYVPFTDNRPGDYDKALYFFMKACDGGHREMCASTADLYAGHDYRGRPFPVDLVKAAELYTRACDGGVAHACAMLGEFHERGTGGVARDLTRAAALYERGCDGGGEKCPALALLLRQGQGVQKDDARATAWLRKGCDSRDFTACHLLALAYRDGLGVESNAAEARTLLRSTCGVEARVGCRDACEIGEAAACIQAADAIDTAAGVAPDPATAGALYERAVGLFDSACAGGDREACTSLTRLNSLVRPLAFTDRPLGLRFFSRACDGRDGDGCYAAARLFDRGAGPPADGARAAALYEQGCDAFHLESCRRLADMFQRGDGVPRDAARAGYFRSRAAEVQAARRRP